MRLDKKFTAILQKSPVKGGHTFVVWPGMRLAYTCRKIELIPACRQALEFVTRQRSAKGRIKRAGLEFEQVAPYTSR